MTRYVSPLMFVLLAGGCGCEPPRDSSGRTPLVFVQDFLRAKDSDAAKDYLLPGSVEMISESWYSGYSYERYFKQLSRYKNCNFYEYKGKSEYWGVRLIGDIDSFPQSEKYFSLKLSVGKWAIDETGPHVPFKLPEVDHAAREAFASFIIEIVTPSIGHHGHSLFDHRDNIQVRRENCEKALSYCSTRVNEAAMHAASLEEFFDMNLGFRSEDFSSPWYYDNNKKTGEIRVVLLYKKHIAGGQLEWDYWTCLLLETTNGWKCDFFISPAKGNLKNLTSQEVCVFEGGDGSSTESAIVVRGMGPLSYHVAEEFWRAKNHPEWKIRDRIPDVRDERKEAYDKVTYLTADGKELTVHFDVREPFYNSPTKGESNSQPDSSPNR